MFTLLKLLILIGTLPFQIFPKDDFRYLSNHGLVDINANAEENSPQDVYEFWTYDAPLISGHAIPNAQIKNHFMISIPGYNLSVHMPSLYIHYGAWGVPGLTIIIRQPRPEPTFAWAPAWLGLISTKVTDDGEYYIDYYWAGCAIDPEWEC